MSVYNTTRSDCDYVFPFNCVSDNDNVFSNNASVNGCTNMHIYSDSSLDHNLESFQYTEYSNSEYDKDLDPINNLYNRVLPSCRYYDDLQFNVITKTIPPDCKYYILMRVVSIATFIASYALCKHLT